LKDAHKFSPNIYLLYIWTKIQEKGGGAQFILLCDDTPASSLISSKYPTIALMKKKYNKKFLLVSIV